MWIRRLGLLLLLTIGLFNIFSPTLLSEFRLMQADPGDTLLNGYFLEHVYQALFNRQYQPPLLSPAFFYPTQDCLLWSDNLLAAGPLYWGLRVLLPTDLAYQMWMMVNAALTFLATWFMLRTLGVRAVLSGLGAYIVAFGLLRGAHLGHQQLLPEYYGLLALLGLYRFLSAPSTRRLGAVALFLLLQILAGIYLGWLLGLALAALALVHYTWSGASRARLRVYVRQEWSSVCGVLMAASAAVLVIYYPYRTASQERPIPWFQIQDMVPHLVSWLTTAPAAVLWGRILPQSPGDVEQVLFPGAVPVGLALFGLWWAWRHRLDASLSVASSSLLTGVLLMLLSLGVLDNQSLWYWVYRFVPGGPSIRAVGRIWTMVEPLLIVGGLLCVERALQGLSVETQRRLAVGLLLVGLLDQAQLGQPAFDKATVLHDTAQMAELMRAGTVGYVVPYAGQPPYETQLEAMWAGLQAGVPVINGYTAHTPLHYPSGTHDLARLAEWLGPTPVLLSFITRRAGAPAAEGATLSSDGRFQSIQVRLPR